jgi:hypothetical protein
MQQARKRSLRSLVAISAALIGATMGIARQASANICYNNGCSINLYGHINIVNNWWGVAQSNASGSQNVWTSSGSGWGSSLNWSAGNNQYQVKSYSGAYDGWNYSSGFNGAPFPKELKNKSAANNSISGYFASNGSQDSIWDSFYNYSSSPGSSNPNMEIEVYITASFYPSNRSYQTTEDGWTWNVYGPGTGAWPVWLFVPLNYTSSENFNLMDLASDLVNHGKVGNTLYMLNDNFGEEPYYTNGNTAFGCSSYSAP